MAVTRRGFMFSVLLLGSFAVAAAPAWAEFAEQLAGQLREEGYRNIEIERTLLRRIKITGETDTHRREIVIDPGTGEILRDLTIERGSALPPPPGEPAASGGGSG